MGIEDSGADYQQRPWQSSPVRQERGNSHRHNSVSPSKNRREIASMGNMHQRR